MDAKGLHFHCTRFNCMQQIGNVLRCCYSYSAMSAKELHFIVCNLIVRNLFGSDTKSIYGFRITDTEKIVLILHAI